MSAIATFVNAIVSVILVSLMYNVLKPILIRSGLLLPIDNNIVNQ